MREGADASRERGCNGVAGWGEVVEDYLKINRLGQSGVSLTCGSGLRLNPIDGWTYVCAFSCEFPGYGGADASS